MANRTYRVTEIVGTFVLVLFGFRHAIERDGFNLLAPPRFQQVAFIFQFISTSPRVMG